MMSTHFYLKNKKADIHYSCDSLTIGIDFGNAIHINASPEQLKQIADTIYVHLAHVEETKALQDQLALNFEQVLEKVAV